MRQQRDTRSRAARRLGLALLVALAHAALLLAVLRPVASTPARTAAVEVRRVVLPSAIAPTATPEPSSPVVVAKPRALPPPRQPPVRAAALPPAAPPVPVPVRIVPPPTRVPPSAELRFVLTSGESSGQALLSWRSDGDRYALALQATLPSGREIEQFSQGGFDAAGVAPVRLADRKGGRDVRAANFQREHGKVTFSGPRWELPLEVGTQDRLSWLVQLVALVNGAGENLRDGTEMAMWVVGARGAASHWRFEVQGSERLEVAGQACEAWHLVREPMHPYDTRVEVWLETAAGHWPVKLRQTQIPGGQPLEWVLQQRGTPSPGT